MLCTCLKPKDPVHQKGPVLSSKTDFYKMKVFSHNVHPLWCVIMDMGICMCDGSLAWAQKCIAFSINKKVDFNKWVSVLWDFALEATSWGPKRHKVPRMVQNATHSIKCHNCRICISWHIIHLHYVQVCMYFGIRKTSFAYWVLYSL